MSEGDSPQVSERKTGGSNVANLVKRISTELQSKSEVPVRSGATDVKQRRVKAAFSYTPQNDDELRLEVDDVVDVLGEEEEGWWKGRLRGKTGVFPANFVKSLDPLLWTETSAQPEEKLKPEESAEGAVSSGEIQPKKVAGVGFGNIFAANQKIELRNVKPGSGSVPLASGDTAKKAPDTGTSSTNAKDVSSQKVNATNGKKPLPNPASSIPEPVSGQKNKEYAKALFDYDAENDDELSFQEGDIIVVLSKEVDDAGWWLGELNGKRGVFPDNFVTQITFEEAEKAKKPSCGVPVGVPPTVPAKPPKPTSSTPPETAKMPSTAVSESKPDTPLGAPKQQAFSKHSTDIHGKTDTSGGADKTTVTPPAASERDRPSMYKKPLVPLVGMVKPKQFNSGRLFAGSGANSPNSEEKLADADGEPDGTTAPDAEKLSHPTASRVRNPNRRPPSQAFLKDMVVESTLPGCTVSTVADDSTNLRKAASASNSSFELINNNGKCRSGSGGEDYVSREEFDKLQAAFESFKRETRERMKEMEKLLSAQSSSKTPKL